MREFPSCFGDNGVHVANEASPNNVTKTAQTLVSCVYHCKSRCGLCFITVSWTKHLMGHGLSISIDNSSKVEIKPWLFSKKKGCRSRESGSRKIKIFWDLTNAKFASGAEPLGEFYVAIILNQQLVLLLGDLEREVRRKIASDPVDSTAIFVSKIENIFGKKFYGAKSQLCDRGRVHDISIECDTAGLDEPSLVVRVDSRTVMKIKRLKWKFRGHHTFLVDGSPVQVFWDVHNWLFGNATTATSAVFLFQTADKPSSSSSSQSNLDPCLLDSSSSPKSKGFSLILYAWKTE